MSTSSLLLVLCLVGGFLLSIFFALVFGKAAAPRNAEEQARDDYEQMKALGYFDETITSGCPVIKEPK